MKYLEGEDWFGLLGLNLAMALWVLQRLAS